MENISCFLCFQPVKDNTAPVDPKFHDKGYKEKLFQCCSRLLGVKIENSCKYSTVSCSPFCMICFEYSEKLWQIEGQTANDQIKDDIKNYIAKFTSDILRFRLAVFAKEIEAESEADDDIDEEYTYQKHLGPSLSAANIPPIYLLPINAVKIKDETVKDEIIIEEYILEDDYGDDEDSILPFSHAESSVKEDYNFGVPKLTKGRRKLSTNAFPKTIPELRVVLERLQFDSNGKVIMPLESLTKRKSAIVARSSLRQNTSQEKIISEDDPLDTWCGNDDDPEFISGDLDYDSNDSEDDIGVPQVSPGNRKRKQDLKTCENNNNSIMKMKKPRQTRKSRINTKKKYSFKKMCVKKRKLEIFMRKERKELKCSNCSSSYNLSWDLDCHSEESGHVNNRNFKCSQCSKSYYGQDDLKWHQRLCIYSNRKCKHCKKVLIFNSMSSYRRHIETHKRKPEAKAKSKLIKSRYKCVVCSATFLAIKLFHEHAKEEDHANTPLFQCKNCPKKYYRLADVNQHHRIWHKFFLQTCSICNKEFTTRRAFDAHKFWHNQLKKGDTSNLTLDKLQKCKLCDATFYQSSDFARHKKGHEKGFPFQCEICFLLYKTERSLDYHMQFHKGIIKKKALDCDSCDQKFTLLCNFIAHKINDHGFPSPFNCKHCKESFTSIKDLTSHRQWGHSEENQKFNENCQLCGKLFKQSSSLQWHTLIHLNVPKESLPKFKPKVRGSHQCAECGKIFFYAHGLTDHWNKMHSPDALKNRVTCNICGKVLANQRYFIKHQSIHSKPYICEICGRGFSEKFSLQSHIKRIHEQNKTPRKSYTRVMYPKPRADKVSYIHPSVVL